MQLRERCFLFRPFLRFTYYFPRKTFRLGLLDKVTFLITRTDLLAMSASVTSLCLGVPFLLLAQGALEPIPSCPAIGDGGHIRIGYQSEIIALTPGRTRVALDFTATR
jgi:hypothetical protein